MGCYTRGIHGVLGMSTGFIDPNPAATYRCMKLQRLQLESRMLDRVSLSGIVSWKLACGALQMWLASTVATLFVCYSARQALGFLAMQHAGTWFIGFCCAVTSESGWGCIVNTFPIALGLCSPAGQHVQAVDLALHCWSDLKL